jgi:hypothetical protein
MFCPKCATKNLDGASFCRSCGANISLIPQALNGQVPQNPETVTVDDPTCRKTGKVITLDQSFKNAFMGLGFLIVAIVLSRSPIGSGWWFWMLIPAFSLMGNGIAQYIRVKDREKRMYLPQSPMQHQAFQPATPSRAIPRRNTGELRPPVASVTEGTTRHLGVEAPTRHLENDR